MKLSVKQGCGTSVPSSNSIDEMLYVFPKASFPEISADLFIGSGEFSMQAVKTSSKGKSLSLVISSRFEVWQTPEELPLIFSLYQLARTSFTLSAASFRTMAEVTFRPDSSMIFAPSSAFVP